MNRRHICVMLIFLSINDYILASENLLLNDMIDVAIENHPKIHVEKYTIKSSEKDLNQAIGEYYPKVDYNIDYGKRDTINTPNRGESTKTNYKGYTSSISVTQNLFNGFASTAKVEQSEEILRSKVISKEIAIDNLTLDVVNSYSNIIKYKKLIKIQTESIKNFNKYNDITLKNTKLTGKQTDYLVVSSKLEKLNSDFLENKWLLRKYQEQFRQLTGKTLPDEAKISPLSFVEILNLSESINFLDSQRNILIDAKNNIDIQKQEINLAKSELYPKIDLELSSSKGKDLDQFETAYDENKVLLKLKYNIFNGMIDKNNIEKRRINHLRAESNYDNILKEVEEKIIVSYELYISSKEKVQRLANYVDKQNKLVDMYQIEFNTGKLSLLTLVNSIQDLNDARVTYTNAYFELINSTYTLAYELGILGNEIKSNNFATNYSY